MSIDIVVLAAGRSSRMGERHKLLARFEGIPLLRRSVETALASAASRVIVVLGHRAGDLAAALAGLDVEIVDNPDHAQGLSTSLIAGFSACSAEGVLVMLADQPLLTPEDLDRLMQAFRPAGAGSIVVATDNGRRFNPVILSRDHGPEIMPLSGDVGAKSILVRHPDTIVEIDLGAHASTDVDTPEAMAAVGGVLAD